MSSGKDMPIGDRIHALRDQLPPSVELAAVSKFHSAEAIMQAYQAGQRLFAENRAQELTAKQKILPGDIKWHFIGSLQQNKVKDIAPFVHTIQSVDSLKLLQEINKQAIKHERIIRVLLEIHIAKEASKHGFTPAECKRLLESEDLEAKFGNIRICGLMGMATFTDDVEQIREEFRMLHHFFVELKSSCFSERAYFTDLSMGMTSDYEIAIQEGSTMIRIGSYIFGHRPPF